MYYPGVLYKVPFSKLKFYVSGFKSGVQLDALIVKNCRSLAHHVLELSSATQMLSMKLEQMLMHASNV